MVGTRGNNTAARDDELTYNAFANSRVDNNPFNPDGDFESAQPIGARGADNQPTGRNFVKEDRETEQSDRTGKIPRGMFQPCAIHRLHAKLIRS